MKICFLADEKPTAMQALRACIKKYGQADLAKADVVIALGGDGFMLQTLQKLLNYQVPVFGLNLGHVGYLLNHFSLDDLPDRVDSADKKTVVPLKVFAETTSNKFESMYAFNEFCLSRSSPQAARLDAMIVEKDSETGQEKGEIAEIFGDGLIVASKMGTHGYYESAGGMPLPEDKSIALQSICCKNRVNKMLSDKGRVCVEVQEQEKRPIHLDCDGQKRLADVSLAFIEQAPQKVQTLLKDFKGRTRL